MIIKIFYLGTMKLTPNIKISNLRYSTAFVYIKNECTSIKQENFHTVQMYLVLVHAINNTSIRVRLQ